MRENKRFLNGDPIIGKSHAVEAIDAPAGRASH